MKLSLAFLFLISAGRLSAAISAKPTKTQIVDVSSSSFVVNWKEKNKGAVTYSVYITTIGVFDFLFLAASIVDTDSAVDKMAAATIAGLEPQTKYWVCVKAQAQGKEISPCSSPDSATTLETPKKLKPRQPTRTQVVEIGADWARVSWKEKNSGATGYILSASTNPEDLSGTLNASLELFDPNSEDNKIATATLTGLKANAQYFFSARSVIEDQVSSFSSPDREVTLARPPRELAVEAGSLGNYLLRWDANGNPPDTPYEVSFSLDNFQFDISTAITFASRFSKTETEISSLLPGLTYQFHVRARNREGVPTEFALSAASVQTLSFVSVGRVSSDQDQTMELPSEKMRLKFKRGSFKDDILIAVSTDPIHYPLRVRKDKLVQAMASLKDKKLIAASLREIAGILEGKKFQNRLNHSAEIELSYATLDSNRDGLLDQADIETPATRLSLEFLDEESVSFKPCPELSLNLTSQTIACKPPELSVYALTIALVPQTSPGEVYAYPVPWQPNDSDPTNGDSSGITFTPLPSEGEIRIFSVDGQGVRSLRLSGSLQILWDARSDTGDFVSSRVYIWILKSPALTKKGKLVIIR